MVASPATASTTEMAIVAQTKNVKRSRASSSSPSPRVRATMALPPVPSMKPMVARIMVRGKAKLVAASAVDPQTFETNRPSVIT